jgi:hypothetical protein
MQEGTAVRSFSSTWFWHNKMQKGTAVRSFSSTWFWINNMQEGTAEEFFIDMILARHARKLLTAGSLTDLGRFCAHLDFHLVTWLRCHTLITSTVTWFNQ